MKKTKKIQLFLGAAAALAGLALLAFALHAPGARRARVAALADEAHAILSPAGVAAAELAAVDCDRASLLLQEARALDPRSGRVLRELPLAAGCASLLRGDLILAEGELRTALGSLQGDPRPASWLGALELTLERPERAVALFERALGVEPAHLPAQLGLSDALAELERHEEALAALERAEGGPLAAIETRRGLLLERLGRVDEARSAYLRAVELDPGAADPRNNLAGLERDRGNLEEAWRHQQAAVELAPDDSLLLLNAGLLAIGLGHDERAEELLRRSAELDPDSPDPLRALGDLLIVRGHPEDAVEILANTVARFPTDGATLNSLGNVLAALGRHVEARAIYERAIEADRSLAQPHNGLAALLLAASDLDGAATALAEAARLDPDDAQVRRNLELACRRAAP